jgi:hypothetical protein
MSDNNKAAAAYLEHYCESDRPLDYAVMLCGPWGAGKTHFVKQFLAQHDIKHLYVSLYGMTNVRQIEEEFWRLLHPLLSSKPMRILAAAGKGLLKATIKVDLDGDGSEDASLSPSAPDIDAVKLANPDGHILVFDDLERCRMAIDDVLGYINSLVEHSGFKVIVIANEAKLVHNERYLEIKEKLIGQTLEVHSSVEDALGEFLASIADEDVAAYLSKSREKIIQVHRLSGSNNLRVLKHALWDFERFAAGFKKKVWKNRDATHWILPIFLALSIEFRLGHISTQEIADLFSDKMVRLVNRASRNRKGEVSSLSRIEVLEEKYKDLSFDQSCYNGRIIAQGLQKGWFDPDATNSGFAESTFFVRRSDQPAWKTVWHMVDVGDKEFDAALAKMEKQFMARHFLEPGEILHVIGLRLFLAGEGVLPLTRQAVVGQAKAYIRDLRSSQRLREGELDEHLSHFSGWDGLGIVENDAPDYRDVLQHLHESMLAALDESLPKKAQQLTADLFKKPEKFIVQVISYGSDNIYRRLPVLKHINVSTFVEGLLSLNAAEQRRIMASLKDRYDHNMLTRELASELPWLNQLREELLSSARAINGIGKWRLSKLVEWNLDPHLAQRSAPPEIPHPAT